MRGVERRVEAGLDPAVGSVASVFVSRWDTSPEAKEGPEDLRSALGIAQAKLTYRAYRELLDSSRWGRLANEGARPQRLLWASTGTKDPEASDVLYVRALAAPFTINTMPEKTLLAFGDHGEVTDFLPADGGDAEEVAARFTAGGADLDALAARLQSEGADAFVTSWDELLDDDRGAVGRPRGPPVSAHGDTASSGSAALARPALVGAAQPPRLARARGAPRGDRRPPPARALRRGPGPRRAPDGRGRRALPRLLQEPGHRRDAGAPDRPGRGVRPARAHRGDVLGARRSTSPRAGPCCTSRCGRRRDDAHRGGRRRRRPRGARGARPDVGLRRPGARRGLDRRDRAAHPQRREHRHRRVGPRAGDGLRGPALLLAPRHGLPLRLERRRRRLRRGDARPRPAPRRSSSSRRRPSRRSRP